MSKLSDADAEAAETQVWVEFAVKCGYLPETVGRRLYADYESILRSLVGMITHSETWVLKGAGDTVR